MDQQAAKIVRKVWAHTGTDGYIWLPTIADISSKTPRFSQGPPLKPSGELPPLGRLDSYWTPAVSKTSRRKASEYGPQRVIWADCDDGFNDKLLTALRPSFLWETSPGRKQAIWLMRERIQPSDFHRDGFVGMLTQALKADAGGVDIPQLLRLPGSWHNKNGAHKGRILATRGTVYTRGQLLTRVARGLGLSAGLASELGADDPYGDRSKKMWQFARSAHEAGIDETLTVKMLAACKWNKYKGEPDKLKEDVARAYAAESTKPVTLPAVEIKDEPNESAQLDAWDMSPVEDFGPVIHAPLNWVVPGIIPEGGCGLLVSSPKVGKTRVAIELALGIATGTAPLGISLQRSSGVGFFSLEDGEYLFSSRMNGSLNQDPGRARYHWDGHITRGLTWHPQEAMAMFTNFTQVDFSTMEDKQRLLLTIQKYELKLVIIDTLSMAIGKSDVNSSSDMYAILKDIKLIAKATGCAIMFIHHTRKRVFEKGESIHERVLGSTALHAWVDFILSLAPPEEDDNLLRLAIQTKMGGGFEYVSQDMKIVKRPKETSEV